MDMTRLAVYGVPAEPPDGVADEDDPPHPRRKGRQQGLSSRRLGSGSPHRPSHVAASVGSRVTELTSTFHPRSASART